MEQYPQYLVWMKNKYMMNSRFQAPTNTFKSSWEEQAFFATDDAAFIWPPRSYSCSFCKRKFRSAQALGGHMNVHRRDRARLKQSLPSQNEVLPHQISTPNPNPSHNTNSDPSYPAFSHSPSIVSDLKHAAEKNARREDFPFMGHGDHVDDEANLSMGLNLVVSENISKRPKTNVLPMPLFLLPCSNDRLGVVKDGSFQGVDLELRLGQ